MDEPAIIAKRRDGVGHIILNRPKSLNALNLEALQALTDILIKWTNDDRVKLLWVEGAGDKAFCAGGDIREAWYDMRDGGTKAREMFYTEYCFNAFLQSYPKPYVAWLDGITMGGGVGASFHGSHPIATEKTLFAMPETSIGLFPDIGASYFFNMIDRKIARFLGLTSARIMAFDLLGTGLLRTYIPSRKKDLVFDQLLELSQRSRCEKTDISQVLEPFNEMPDGETVLPGPSILSCFAKNSLIDIIALLEKEEQAGAEILSKLYEKSPFSMHMFLYLLNANREKDIKAVMSLEYRASQAAAAYPDLFEGIRSVLIDKDRNPKWHEDIHAFSNERIKSMLVKPIGGDLKFVDAS